MQVEGKDRGGNLTESGWIIFVTGALVPEDFQGQWIGTGEGKPFYARKRWNLTKKVKSAYALVCGLGQFRFYINGKKVSDHELDPGWTNYDRKVQYVMFDIAPYLREGENVFGVSVGNGFYLGDKGGRYFFEMPPEAMKRFMPPNTNGYRPFRRCASAERDVSAALCRRQQRRDLYGFIMESETERLSAGKRIWKRNL